MRLDVPDLIGGFIFEGRCLPDDSRYSYAFAVIFTWAVLTRSGDLPRALRPIAPSDRPVDPRPARIPIPPQRRYLFFAGPPLRPLDGWRDPGELLRERLSAFIRGGIGEASPISPG